MLYAKKKDIIALGILLAIPTLAIGITAALGYHAMLTGDNQIQNFPLRVLVGRDIASGHLPLWNPLNWSGTPLLASFNSGALYPPVLLFAVFPPLTAWALTWILTYWICISGTYLLCRKLSISPWASALGAATFSFAGTMSLQIAHLQVMEGDAWIPWILLGVEGLAAAIKGRPSSTDPYLRTSSRMKTAAWTALIALSIAMTVLSGSTSTMAAAGVMTGLVVLWHFFHGNEWKEFRRRAVFLALSVLAALWGFGLSSIQILTGLQFVGISQRSDGSASYAFGSYSISFARWLFLFLPGIAGGSGNFRLPKSVLFIADNATYFGLLPLVAFFALLAVSLSRHRHTDSQKWAMWIVVAVVGAVLAMGSALPGGSILSHIPFYGGLRVQARNIVITDLAVAVILGFWLDRILSLRMSTANRAVPAHAPVAATATCVSSDTNAAADRDDSVMHGKAVDEPSLARRDHSRTSGQDRHRRSPSRKEVVAGAIPVLAAVVLAVIGLTNPTAIEHALSITGNPANVGKAMWPSVLETLILAMLASILAWKWPKLSSRSIRTMATAIVILDLGFFAMVIAPGFRFSGVNSIVPRASGFDHPPFRKLAPGPIQPGTRYALFDPNFADFTSALRHAQIDENVLAGVPSIQGYGSVVWGPYDLATCTHAYDSVRVSILASDVSNELDLGTLLAAQGNFVNPAGSGQAAPPPSSSIHMPCPPSAYTSIPAPSGSATGTGTAASSTPSTVTTSSSSYIENTSDPGSSGGSNTTSAPTTQASSAEWYIGSLKTVSQVTIAIPAAVQNILDRSSRSKRATTAHPSRSDATVKRPARHPTKHTTLRKQVTRKPTMQIELLEPSGAAAGSTGLTSNSTAADITSRQSPTLSIARSSYATQIRRRGKTAIYSATFSKPVSAIAIRVTGPAAAYIQPENLTIKTTSGAGPGNTLTLNGPLVNVVRPGKWTYSGTFGQFLAFHNTEAYGHLWLASLGSSFIAGGNLSPSVLSSPGDALSILEITQAGNEVDRVTSTSPALLVRSMAWAPGWTATVTTAGKNGKITERVSRYGIVQAAPIPQGTSTVSFSYWPPGMTQGIVLTGVSLIALAGIAAACIRQLIIRKRRIPRLLGK